MTIIQMRKSVFLLLLALLFAISFWSRPAQACACGGVGLNISAASATYNSATDGFDMQVNWSATVPSGTIQSQKVYIVPSGTYVNDTNYATTYHELPGTVSATGAADTYSWTSSASVTADSMYLIGPGNPLVIGNYYNVQVVVGVTPAGGGSPSYFASGAMPIQLSRIAVSPVTITTGDQTPANPTYAKAGDTVNLTFTLSMAPSALPTVQIAYQDEANVAVSSVGNNVYKAQYTFTGSENAEGNTSIQIKVLDGSNQSFTTATTDSSAVFYDKTNPTGTLTINNGVDPTNTTAVTLNIIASDTYIPHVYTRLHNTLALAGTAAKPIQLASTDQSVWSIQGLLAGAEPQQISGSGVDKMQFSNDNVNWSGWEPFSETKSWILADGDGVKTVYMRLIDKAGNEMTQPVSANILLQLPISITPVTFTTGNQIPANPTYAKTGDTANLTFTLSKAPSALPTVQIAYETVTVTSVGNNVYKAQLTFTDSVSMEGNIPIFISAADGASLIFAATTTDSSAVFYDKTNPTGTFTINNGAASTNTTAVTLNITGSDWYTPRVYSRLHNTLAFAGTAAKPIQLASTDQSVWSIQSLLADAGPQSLPGSGVEQMQFSNDGVNWSEWEPYATTKAWTLSYGNGTKTVYMKLKDKVGNEMTTPYTATIDLQQPFYSSSGSSYTPSETITVNVENGVAPSGSVVSTATINRTTDANGRKTDAVTFTLDQVNKTVDQLKAAGSDSARIVIPDPKDEVSEVNVTIPKASTDSLVKGNVGVEISTANGRVDIPKSSLEGFADDVYFRFVPIKTEDERKVVEDRAKKEQEVRLAVGNDNISIVGRPMTIETNLQSRPVTLVIPLGDTSALTEQQLQNLGVFIEHSDGTKEFVKGQIVNYDDSGKLGIQFTVTKFSTFTVVKTDGLNKTTHKAYINGYPDGTFGPEKNITRAEMASLLARVSDKAATKSSIAYTDVASLHWAKDAIDQATKMGLMEGYNGGSFKPEQTITRAEMAAILSRISGNSASSGDSFNDVNGHWAQSAVAQAKAAGYIDGYADGTFRPEQTLTRAEAVTMINKLLGRGPLSGAASKWSDVSSGSWAFEQIQEASIDHTSEKNATGGEQWVTTP
ncbi:S-layer homology domain-containing protein [Paenibacillus thalictri]|uniref:SLH domain-containing protein n=1 Tax=Paenibacillus thalictri TaxID=2527873 RepID=A0A4Q9DFZ3_9BACL|nr:S-layer homology domain-containing protein [Paenibacillus thalictri]TBL71075.1 hypothetical protein EYB31_31520 [Paenibacillus thalictri]